MKASIGIFGGTFNPIHLGHLIMAQDALETFELLRILFVPCDKPPHKDTTLLAPVSHRVAMLERALAGNPQFELCDMEVRRGGTNYTIDTIRALKKHYPDQELVFLVGSDTLPELHRWKDVYELFPLCRMVVMARPGFDAKALNNAGLKLAPPWPERLMQNVATAHQADISSSDIRHRVAEGMSIRYLTPAAVESYIHENKLYK